MNESKNPLGDRAEVFRITLFWIGEGKSGNAGLHLVPLSSTPLVFKRPTLPEVGDLAGQIAPSDDLI